MDFRLPISEFESRYKKEKNTRAKTRLHVLLLRRQKYTQKEIAVLVRITQGTVSNICRRFFSAEFFSAEWSSVYDKPRSGKPSRLTAQQKVALRERLAHEYVDGKVRRGWQTKDVAQFIRDEFSVKYTTRAVRDLLYEFGMSWKVPRPEHKNRDEKAVMAFKKSSPGRYCLWQMSTKSSA